MPPPPIFVAAIISASDLHPCRRLHQPQSSMSSRFTFILRVLCDRSSNYLSDSKMLTDPPPLQVRIVHEDKPCSFLDLG